jgi:hypothetical protein
LYDRQWAAADAGGAALTQARAPRLARIVPAVDLRAGTLTLRLAAEEASSGGETEPVQPPLVIPLSVSDCDAAEGAPAAADAVRVCGTRRTCARGADAAAAAADAWLSRALRTPCRLVRCDGAAAFANEGALLLVTAASLAALNASIARRAAAAAAAATEHAQGEQLQPAPPAGATTVIDAQRFRPNVVLSGTRPYEEDAWCALSARSLGGAPLRVAAACGRCAQVCVDPRSGRRDGREPLLTLTAERMRDGRPRFGVLLASPPLAATTPAPVAAEEEEDDDDGVWMARTFARVLRVGERVTPLLADT